MPRIIHPRKQIKKNRKKVEKDHQTQQSFEQNDVIEPDITRPNVSEQGLSKVILKVTSQLGPPLRHEYVKKNDHSNSNCVKTSFHIYSPKMYLQQTNDPI